MGEPLSCSGRVFTEELRAYLEWVRLGLEQAGLSWQDIAVIERADAAVCVDSWPRGSECSAAHFEARFSVILASVQRCWVNLTAVTIDDARLIVAVDWVSHAWSDRDLPPGRPVSVNWSGMSQDEIGRLAGHVKP